MAVGTTGFEPATPRTPDASIKDSVLQEQRIPCSRRSVEVSLRQLRHLQAEQTLPIFSHDDPSQIVGVMPPTSTEPQTDVDQGNRDRNIDHQGHDASSRIHTSAARWSSIGKLACDHPHNLAVSATEPAQVRQASPKVPAIGGNQFSFTHPDIRGTQQVLSALLRHNANTDAAPALDAVVAAVLEGIGQQLRAVVCDGEVTELITADRGVDLVHLS